MALRIMSCMFERWSINMRMLHLNCLPSVFLVVDMTMKTFIYSRKGLSLSTTLSNPVENFSLDFASPLRVPTSVLSPSLVASLKLFIS